MGKSLSLGNDTSEILVVLKLTILHFHHHWKIRDSRWETKSFSLKSLVRFSSSMIWEEGIDFGVRCVTSRWPYWPDLMLVVRMNDVAWRVSFWLMKVSLSPVRQLKQASRTNQERTRLESRNVHKKCGKVQISFQIDISTEPMSLSLQIQSFHLHNLEIWIFRISFESRVRQVESSPTSTVVLPTTHLKC